MRMPKPNFSISVDVTNPGQFFACCGVLELAHRLWPGAEGWFEDNVFKVAAANDGDGFEQLAACLRSAKFCSDDPAAAEDEKKICPLRFSSDQIASMRLDWWLEEDRVGGSLKTWAGQQNVTGISQAMLHTTVSEVLKNSDGTGWFDYGAVAHDPGGKSKSVEPFYFDARRYAHALDTGFSIDAIGAEAIAYPSVELMALIGLQRFRPQPMAQDRTFEYFTWSQPMGVVAAAAVACGAVPVAGRQGFRFSLKFRDNQKRYKAFGFANRIGGIR